MTQVVSEEKPKQPLEDPGLGPKGPRTPYPVDEPIDPKGPGSEPDYFPGKPGTDSCRSQALLDPWPIQLGSSSRSVSWLQAH